MLANAKDYIQRRFSLYGLPDVGYVGHIQASPFTGDHQFLMDIQRLMAGTRQLLDPIQLRLGLVWSHCNLN